MESQIELHGRTGAQRRPLNREAGPSEAQVESNSIGRRVIAFLRGGEEGSSLIEIALTMPILLAVITAICTFAVGFNNQLTLTSAVGAGAQYLQLIRTTTSDPCADTLNAIKSAAPSLKSSSLSLSFNLDGTIVTGSSCPSNTANLVQGEPVTVTATYPCVLSIMPMGYGTKFVSNCQLSAKVTEYEY
jgi:Flp pilus assembly protein TadG